MGERSDFNRFMEVSNSMTKMVKEKFERSDELWRSHHQTKKENERLTADNERLRQMISNDSEMNHRSHQSSAEHATSSDKQSYVIHKYKAMDGKCRRQTIEAFGKQLTGRAELWYRKDLTCRIFQTAYEVAEQVRNYFNRQPLPTIFQCAPFVAALLDENFSQGATKLSQQHVSEDMQNLLSAESFKVAYSSLLKEIAVNYLEEKIVVKLRNRREQWRESYPWLPYLDDSLMEKTRVKSYIKECARVAWRMVNLLPPLKIVTVDCLQGRPFDNFFETEIEKNRENAQTMNVCVWPCLTHGDDAKDVICKGMMVTIPRPKNYPHTV